MRKEIIYTIMLLIFVSFMLSVAQAQNISIQNPWLRAAPPNTPALALFMTIKNHSNQEVSLVKVKAPKQLGRVELHRTIMQDGVMQMEQQAKIPVAAYADVILKPGSWHIMLINPTRVPGVGDQVVFTLLFSDGITQEISADVRKK